MFRRLLKCDMNVLVMFTSNWHFTIHFNVNSVSSFHLADTNTGYFNRETTQRCFCSVTRSILVSQSLLARHKLTTECVLILFIQWQVWFKSPSHQFHWATLCNLQSQHSHTVHVTAGILCLGYTMGLIGMDVDDWTAKNRYASMVTPYYHPTPTIP